MLLLRLHHPLYRVTLSMLAGRPGNEVAFGLAKHAKFVEDVNVWMEETPSCVGDQVNFDMSHLIS